MIGHTLKVGDKVTYRPTRGPLEHGIVKRLHDTNPLIVFVVYKCAGDWANYQNYTAAATDYEDIEEGWSEQ